MFFLSIYYHIEPNPEFAFGVSKTLSIELFTIIRVCRLKIILQ